MSVRGATGLIFMTMLLTACGGGETEAPAAAAANVWPMADAGVDQVVDEQTTVALDGGASSDSDGSIAGFSWAQLSGPPVVLSSSGMAVTTFDAPALSVATTLSFELRVTDDRNGQATDVTTVIVNPIQGLNQRPSAGPGPDRMARELGNVLLDGTGSSDTDGSIASYFWQQISGPTVVLTNASAVRASFSAPIAPAVLEFELIVTDNEGAADAARITITVVPATVITLSGRITFDLVPSRLTPPPTRAFLDFGSVQTAPARGITVELIDAVDGVTVLGAGQTDVDGAYSIVVPNLADALLRTRAQLVKAGAPGWDFRVVDNFVRPGNPNGDALYVVDGAIFNTGVADLTRDLHAESGWDGSSYSAPRAAAPLAILDLIYDGVALILSADPTVILPPLDIHWSPENRPAFGADGTPDVAMGELGTSFFRSGPGGGIFLLGAEAVDTEEYDRHVIAHEWGHYLEAQFSRSDSIGGPHTTGDQLDMRVAFGEGWGNALSAMVTGDSVYRDTFTAGLALGFAFDIEGEARQNPGWYSEFSVQEILYDIFDATQDLQLGTIVTDEVSLGFGPIFDVFVNVQRTTPVLTSLFPFVNAIKAGNPGAAAAIDALLGVHNIEPIIDDYGSTEDNAGSPASADILPIYTQLTVNGGAVNVCSTDEFSSGSTGSTNKLGSRRYLRFQAMAGGTHTFSAVTTGAPAGTSTDPDMWLHRVGRFLPGLPTEVSDDRPSPSCDQSNLSACSETFTFQLGANLDYVLEIYEWTNTNASDDPDYPPIGRACFDVEVTQP